MNKFYFNRYLKLIDYCTAQQWHEDRYTEKHHILPRCFGGDNEKDNIVVLPYRLHVMAHYLLAKAYPECPSLYFAYSMVSNPNVGSRMQFKKLELLKECSSIASKLMWQDPAYRKRMHKVLNSKTRTEKISKNSKLMWQNDEWRNNMLSKFRSKNYRELQSKLSKERWKNKEFKEAQMAKRLASGHNSRVSETQKELWKTPEHRAKMAAVLNTPQNSKRLSKKCTEQNKCPKIHALQRKGQIRKLPLESQLVYEFYNKETGHAFCSILSATRVVFGESNNLVKGKSRRCKGYICLCLLEQPPNLELYW